MRLPVLQARPQGAERPSLATVRPTDLGLGAVAREADAWQAEVEQTRQLEEEAQRFEDEKAIEPVVQDLQTRFEEQFSARGAEWDGVSPGWARSIQSDFEAYSSETLNRPDMSLTPGQRDALTRRLSQYREATGQRAIQYEAQRRGALSAETAAARDATLTGARMAAYTEAFGTARQTIDQEYDGSQADYAQRVIAEHDRVAEQIIAETPEALRPRVTQTLASTRLQLLGQAMDAEARTEQGFIAGQARTALSALTNGVMSAPSLYENAVGQIDQITAGLPPTVRDQARTEGLNDVTEAYVTGLIQQGQQDTALSLLNGGTLDRRLQPETKARLLTRATQRSEALSVDDWMARLRLEQGMEDSVASMAATGVGGGVDLATVEQTLGAQEAAQYALRLAEAEALHGSTEGFAQMTPAQIREQVAALQPQPGQEGFADAQRRYEVAARAAEVEITARTEDPAAWALRNAPALQAGIAALGDGDPVTARREAAAYGAGTLALQRTAGIPAAEQRLLPKETAAALVEAAENNADPTAGLIGLGQVVEAFAPPVGASGETVRAAYARQRMIVNELQAAGADNGDIAAAVDLAGDPVRLGRYVAATRGQALENLPRTSRTETDQQEIEDAVDRELSPYLRSFEGMPVSAALTGGRRLMAQRLAAQQVATRGGSVRDAAREAAEVVAGQYVFVGPSGWRMPRRLAERRDGGPERTAHQTLAQRGAARVMAGLTRNDGEGFYTPADDGSGLSPEQRRERYADSVAARGRWVTTPDDQGLVLMHPTLDGTYTPALDREGRPIVRSWTAIVDGGRNRRGRGGSTSGRGGSPRGIRNNNPLNIEYRSTNGWEGQTGSDGRFARFRTPEQGIRAGVVTLQTYASRGLNTVAEIIGTWAPPSENNTSAYAASIARAIGVGPNDPIDTRDPRVLTQMIAGMIQIENGEQPYSPELIREGVQQALNRERARGGR
jgi:hypothetical protein